MNHRANRDLMSSSPPGDPSAVQSGDSEMARVRQESEQRVTRILESLGIH
jgi:hypothetical protein